MNIKIEPVSFTLSVTAVAIIFIGAVWTLIKYYAQKQVDQQFNKRIEEYRSELQLIVESKKFDFQRMSYDFNLYRNKKHEYYPELYKLTISAITALRNLMFDWQMPQFEKFSSDKLALYLAKKGMAPDKIKESISSHNDGLFQNIIYEIKTIEWAIVKQKFVEANNFFESYEIFLSKDVIDISRIIFGAGDQMIKSVAWDILYKSYDNDEEVTSLRPDAHINTQELYKVLFENGEKLKSQLKKELSVADYT